MLGTLGDRPSSEDKIRVGAALERNAILRLEQFCDTLNREDDMAGLTPFELSASMRTQLIADQWADQECLAQLQKFEKTERPPTRPQPGLERRLALGARAPHYREKRE